MEEKKQEDSDSFDFKKIKGWFKKSEDNSDSASLGDLKKSVKKTGIFLKKYGPLFLVLIPIILSIFLRVQPAYLPVTDDWAKDSVYRSYKAQIGSQVKLEYPNLPAQNINALVDREFESYLDQNKVQIENDIQGTSEFFRSKFQDVNGDTYLSAIDPWFWLRHARNVLNNGHPGDELRDGKWYDSFMVAPVGRVIPGDMFHAYFIAFMYKITSAFSDVTPMKVSFFIPALIAALAVIPAFFIVRKIAGNFGGFIAGVIVAIHPAFLVRTIGGFSDTDAYNVFFPLFITWIFLESLETKSLHQRIGFTILNGFLIGLYAFTWNGWWYIFDFILAALVIYTVYYILINWREHGLKGVLKHNVVKNAIMIFVAFFVVSAIFVSIFTNFGTFSQATIDFPLSFIKLKEVGITTVWPNVFTTVAEQNPASLTSVINQTGLGSLLLFFIGLIGLVLALIRGSKAEKKIWYVGLSSLWYFVIIVIAPQDLMLFLGLVLIPIILLFVQSILQKFELKDAKLAIILVIWFVATVYASTKGVRFGLMVVPAFGLSFGIALGMAYRYISKNLVHLIKIDKTVARVAVIIVLLTLLLYPVNVFGSSYRNARSHVPSFNDGWFNSLDKINNEATPDAIITSWWDFGHWFKYHGNRSVTFDGTSQNSPNAHWVGKILSISDEKKAVGILRMIHCGQNSAYDILVEETADEPEAIDILNEIFVLDKKEARDYLNDYGIKNTEEILKFTHCDPPEAYFIASDDMIGKSGVWSHFGNWNFNRGLMYNTLKKVEYSKDFSKSVDFLEERFDMTEQQASNTAYEIQDITNSKQANDWISPWPSYQSAERNCKEVSENNIECEIPVQNQVITFEINLETLDTNIKGSDSRPNAIWIATADGMDTKEFEGGIGLSIVVYPEGNVYKSFIAGPEIAGGMFSRMFFLKGHSLEYFRSFSFQQTVTGGRIYVYKVDWDGDEMQSLDIFKQPEIIMEEVDEIEEVAENIEVNETEEDADNNTLDDVNNTDDEVNESENNTEDI
ncbi:STT3 domain-containing protein [Nanoarchaeota archaeon]